MGAFETALEYHTTRLVLTLLVWVRYLTAAGIPTKKTQGGVFFFFVKSLDLLWENPGKHPKVWPRKP